MPAVQNDGRIAAGLGHAGVPGRPFRFGLGLKSGRGVGDGHQRRVGIGGRQPETHAERGSNEHVAISLGSVLRGGFRGTRRQTKGPVPYASSFSLSDKLLRMQ